MTHTKASTLSAFVLGGAVVIWAMQWLLTSLGEPAFVPPLTGGVGLALVGMIILALAWPIRALVKNKARAQPVDPQFATRVVLLAKASALAGAGVGGAAVGALVFFVSRPVLSDTALWLSLASLAGALVLGTCGLVAERWCTLPPDGQGSSDEGQLEGEPS